MIALIVKLLKLKMGSYLPLNKIFCFIGRHEAKWNVLNFNKYLSCKHCGRQFEK